jgi:hypothetical protein
MIEEKREGARGKREEVEERVGRNANKPCKREESLLDVDVALGGSLEEAETKLIGELLTLLLGNDLSGREKR